MNRPVAARSLLATADTDPYPYFEELRSQGPLVWDETMKAWLVVSYELCKYIETREDLFRHPYVDVPPTLIEIKGGRRNVTILHGDEHLKMHRFMLKLFAYGPVESYRRDHIRPVLDFLLERLAKQEHVDLAADFSDQFATRVISSLFGMPWRDDALMARQRELSQIVFDWIGAVDRSEAGTARAIAASRALNEMLLPFVRDRRDNPGNDIISRVWAEGSAALDDMQEEDVLVTCRELYFAGSDTTSYALANALYMLLTDDSVRASVVADRGATLDTFVEEALRLYGSVQYRFRLTNQEIEVGGITMPKDTLLVPINSAANRDPEKYACPAHIDLKRPMAKSHLAFNLGPRSCVGAALARAEMRDAIDVLLDRLPNLRLDPDATPPRFRNLYLRSYRPLNVRFG